MVHKKIKKVLRLFFEAGLVCLSIGLFCCTLAGTEKKEEIQNDSLEALAQWYASSRLDTASGERSKSGEEGGGIIMEVYRNERFRRHVLAFFGDIIKSESVAELVLRHALEFEVSPTLAVALMWEESRFNPRAVNRNTNGSIDRGLFQLNSSSFTKLKEEDFFDPAVNVHSGIAHLAWCLEAAGSDVAALAVYNAGYRRVTGNGAPKRTLDYVSRVLEFQQELEGLFLSECLSVPLAAAR